MKRLFSAPVSAVIVTLVFFLIGFAPIADARSYRKMSGKLRDRQQQSAASGTPVRLILQLDSTPEEQLNFLLQRSGVRVRRNMSTLGIVELGPPVKRRRSWRPHRYLLTKLGTAGREAFN
jgi:hypothetical protein